MFIRLLSLVALLATIVIAAYLYIASLNKTTAPAKTSGSQNSSQNSDRGNVIQGAGNAVQNFNQQSQNELNKAQSIYGQ